MSANPNTSPPISTVLGEVEDEIQRQDGKWGQQNHPDFDQVLLTRLGGCTPQRMAEHYEIPSESRAKQGCQTYFGRGEGNWAWVLLEEFCEAVGACNDGKDRLREELVQVAAVTVQWIAAIDRR